MQDFSLTQLLLDASLGVQAVLAILIFMSIYSWSLIFKKVLMFNRYKKELNHFNSVFWHHKTLYLIHKNLNYKNAGFIGQIFKNSITTFFNTQKEIQKIPKDRLCEIIVGDFEVALQHQEQTLNKDLSSLATISSTAPYIGLLGTVYGILVAFWGLGLEQGATIAEIAPSIAEALIATAMGLFVAIPALIAFNKFANDATKLKENYLTIEDEIVNFVNKSYLDKHKKTKRAQNNGQQTQRQKTQQ